ncbi:transglycosylase [Acinetobacter sp. NRRL B-65365]|uniref:transglycosylase SLT domain-containing protein n=1 Tax=Acinetobacter sp. NRRL B-65365 TaxID=1785092 RepID=UPI0007A0CC92|nr:transglycosylase SLT domain-containing protein [Acinetobacter sp. NRRL B-65365]KYQ83566.1 transglycosylase [Acinetobacter sp. NRRL B-65365]
MSWLDTFSDDEQQSVEELQNKGLGAKPQQPKEVGLFDGAASSPFRGAGAGFAKVADVVAAPVDAVTDRLAYSFKDVSTNNFIEPYEEFKAKREVARDNIVLEGISNLEDKENTGTVGQIGFGLGDFATRAITGSALGGLAGAIGVTGGSETNYKYKDLVRKGVDSETALKVASVDGVVAGASAALPLSYGLRGTGGVLADAALSVGGATALSTGGQFASGEILENAGYKKQAKEYEITYQSVGTDLLLNGLFFGASRGYARYLDKSVKAELDSLNQNPEAKSTVVESTLEVNRMQMDDSVAPVKPANPIQENNHLINLDDATDQIRTGRPVNVVKDVKGDEKRKPFDIESSALPANAKLIARKANQDGVDPTVALTISQLESNFNHTAQPPIGKDGKRLSSAFGLFQVLDKTWGNLGGGDRRNVEEQIRVGLKHIKHANNYIKQKLGREPIAHEQYLGHLLGPAGAVNVLKADPSAKLIDVVRKYDPENANKIVKNNGMSGMTVEQAIDKWRKKWNTVSARFGGESRSTAYGMDGTSYDVAYEVKDLNDLIASNDALFAVNPRYPAELQPRDRTREASRQQIERMADDLKPELLGESYKLSDGAPIIGLDNVVESGNGRTMAISKAYADGKAEAYRKFVSDYANTRGFDISGINNPVLVRTRISDVDRASFARLANESDVAQFSASERAKSDVNRLPDASMLRLNSDGNINLEGSMDYVRSFVDQLPQSERSNAITSDGRLSQQGKTRIETALASQAYGDSNLVARLSENIGEEGKVVLNALLRSAPQLAQLSDLVKQGGRYPNTIATDLAQAAQKLSDLKANDLKVDDYLNQGQLIDDGLSPSAREFLQVFDQNNRSSKAISDFIKSKVDEVEALGDPRQGSLFGDTPDDIAFLNILNDNPNQMIAVKRITEDGVETETQIPLHQLASELEADAKSAEIENLATQTAINCALQYGE